MSKASTDEKDGAVLDLLVDYLDDWRGPARKTGWEDELYEKIIKITGDTSFVTAQKAILPRLQGWYLRVNADSRRQLCFDRRKERLVKTWAINYTKSRFCHEVRLGLRINFPMLDEFAKRDKLKPRRVTNVQWFIDKLISDSKKNQKTKEHMIILDGVLIHGARDRDIELTIVTDNSIRAISHYICFDLPNYKVVTETTTNMVSYSHARQSADWKAL